MIKYRYEYQKAAAKLRDKILRGQLKPSQRLSGERELCLELGVSRITIRLALDLLEQQNLIIRRHGSGTYVSNHPHANLPFGVDYGSRARADAAELDRKLILMEWTTGATARGEFQILSPDEEVLHIKRVFYAETVPVIWDQGYILKQFGSRLLESHLTHVDHINTWMRVEKFQITVLTKTISAVAANQEDAGILHIKVGKPMVKSVEEVRDQKGNLAGIFMNRYHPDKLSLTTSYDWTIVQRLSTELSPRVS